MGHIKLRFSPEVDQDQYRKEYNPSTKKDKVFQDALSKSWGLMQYFTKLEEGLSRLIVIGLGLGNPAPWKELAYQIGKTFSAAQQVEMIEDLTKRGALIITEGLLFQLPTDISKEKKEFNFYKTCRLAMEYRNELAHNGIIVLVRQEQGVISHYPIIGLDNPRSKIASDIFQPTCISLPSTIDKGGNTIYLSFQDWAFRLANSVPIYFSEPSFTPGTPIEDKEEFLNYHKERLSQKFEKFNQGKLKKIDKLIDRINNLET